MTPGQKVVCVRDCWDVFPDHLVGQRVPLPRAGVEYVVRSTAFDADGPGIRLHWLILPANPAGIEPAFSVFGRDGAPNFKPVIETDISIFTAMLSRPPRKRVKERERAS